MGRVAVDPSTDQDRPAEDLDALLATIQETYPPLAGQNLAIRRGLKDPKGRLLEYYAPWEPYSPSPGTHTIEVREPGLRGRVLEEMVAGDALHALGAVDPRTGAPVDPVWRTMKDAFAASMSPRTMEREQIAYQTRQKRGEETRPFQTYFDNSRLDAYIRAGIFPMTNPNWQKPGVFTPEQQRVLERMREYLTTGRAPMGTQLARSGEAVAEPDESIVDPRLMTPAGQPIIRPVPTNEPPTIQSRPLQGVRPPGFTMPDRWEEGDVPSTDPTSGADVLRERRRGIVPRWDASASPEPSIAPQGFA